MSNHRNSAEVLRCTAGDAKYISDAINDDMRAADIQVNNTPVKASPVTNPNRLKALREFHRNHEDLCRFNPGYVFELCQRGLEIWPKCATVRFGHYDHTHDAWP